MKRLAVIGFPIKHSISPAIQQAALDACGVDARYERLEVAPADVPAFVAGLRGGEWLGANVTVPHKEAVIPLLDGLSAEAASIGAVNAIAVSDGRLVGHNTDALGFHRALLNEGGFDPRGERVVLLGAGGAARGVLWALARSGATRIQIFNRHRERGERLAEVARSWGGRTEVVAQSWDHDLLSSSLADSGLLVNATSVGLSEADSPLPAELIPRGVLVMDLIFNPRPTRLLREAALRGARTLDGLPMLVYQGAAAFELWTGRSPSVEVMFAAAEEALKSVNSPHPDPLPGGEGAGRSPRDA